MPRGGMTALSVLLLKCFWSLSHQSIQQMKRFSLIQQCPNTTLSHINNFPYNVASINLTEPAEKAKFSLTRCKTCPSVYLMQLVEVVYNPSSNVYKLSPCVVEIFQLQKSAKHPQCNFDFINKIRVQSDTEFSQSQLVKLKLESN